MLPYILLKIETGRSLAQWLQIVVTTLRIEDNDIRKARYRLLFRRKIYNDIVLSTLYFITY